MSRLILPSLAGLLLAAAPLAAQLAETDRPLTYSDRSEVSEAEAAAMRRIEGHMAFLASDAMAGRDTGTIQGELAARYVATQLHSFGFEPAGDDGTFLQTYPLVRTWLDEESLGFDMITADGERHGFRPYEDYALRNVGPDGMDLDVELVFAGHGLVHEDSEVDDFAGLDLEGKLAVVLWGSPSGVTEPGLVMAAQWRSKQREALARGAVGILLVTTPGDEREAGWFRYAAASMRHEGMALGGSEPRSRRRPPRIYLAGEAGRELFAAAGHDLDAEIAARESTTNLGGFPMDGVRLAVKGATAREDIVSWNTVGILPGSDPELADEVIVLSAHMDHVGVEDDDVFNGADDNASGTTTVMMVAQALARDPLAQRRSVAVLLVSGEERGLLGSEWWVNNPTIPIERVVANINIDMVGRNASGEIGVTPSPEHADYNTLVERAVGLGPEADIDVEWFAGEGDFRRRVDEYYYRSDHVNFAKADIPVIFFFAGEHEDYHKPTDTLDKIDIPKMLKVANLVTILTRTVANDIERPVLLGDDR